MAGIIKGGILRRGADAPQTASFHLEDVATQADAYLENIRRQAVQILEQTKQQVATLEQQARERGQEAANQHAVQVAQKSIDQRLQSLLPALEQSITAIRQSREAWVREWEQRTIQLACAIAERIVRGELSRLPEISLQWVRESLELVTGEGRISVHLHPADCETLGERAQQLLERLTRVGTASIVPDPAVERGGCVVTTDFGSIDQQVSSQLSRIADELVS